MSCSSSKIRVAVVEKSEPLQPSVTLRFRSSEDFEVVGSWGTGEEAVERMPSTAPGIALVDLNLPRMSGVACIRILKKILPKTVFFMLTEPTERLMVIEGILAGATEVVLKRSSAYQPGETILEFDQGGTPFSVAIAYLVLLEFERRDGRYLSTRVLEDFALSRLEREILQALSRGLSYKDIAERLNLSVKEARGHIQSAYAKLSGRRCLEECLIRSRADPWR